MAWLSVDEYAKLKGLSSTAIYKQIKQDKLVIKKGEHNRTMIQTDLEQNKQQTVISGIDDITKHEQSEQLESLKEFVGSLISEFKTSKDNEIRTLKDSYERILTVKEEQIEAQKSELVEIKIQLEKIKDQGFLKRLLGR